MKALTNGVILWALLAAAAEAQQTVTVDGSQRRQTVDGFGVNANVAQWNNGELRAGIDQLADTLGATVWRVIIDNSDWEATNDNADPFTFNWTAYNAIYTSAKFQELWNTIAYLNQKGFSSTVMLNFMGPGPGWLGGSDLAPGLEDEWVEMIASLVSYGRITRGVQFGLLAPVNEQDWNGLEGIRMPSGQYVTCLRKLVQRLEALGLGSLRLVGPDTASIGSGVNDYMPAMMGDATVMSKVDHFVFHNYGGDSGGADAAIQGSAYPTRNFWISEYAAGCGG